MNELLKFMATHGHIVLLPWGGTVFLFTGEAPNIQAATVTVMFKQTTGSTVISHGATVSCDTKGVITVSNVT